MLWRSRRRRPEGQGEPKLYLWTRWKYDLRVDTVVIGAGPGGLAAAAMLRERGIEAVVLERDAIGASWRSHYDRLHLHTVRWMSNLPGLRFNRAHGRWVHRDGVVRYLERYAAHHGLEVRLGVDVRKLDRAEDDTGWVIHTTDGPLHARAVVVATGYNRIPFIPEWPGKESFEGELLHGQDYRNGEAYRGRDVLVVGSGNTGAEIAVDLVEHEAARVRMAVRTPPNIVLREQNGMPSQVTGLLMRRLPPKIGDPLAAATRKLVIGDLTEYGLPDPPRGLLTAFLRDDVVPIIDVGTVDLIKRGRIAVVAGVVGFEGASVLLADGSSIEPDAVISCAGYKRGLEPLVGHLGLIGAKGRPIVHGPEMADNAPDLHFIGFTNPISGMFREFGFDAKKIARVQARRRAAAASAVAA
jgi:putative flavoprotein involved in K+ transport